MSNDIYKKYNVDLSKLKRDYLKEPLKNNEKPQKEDIIYLYIELNISQKDLSKYFNKTESTLNRWNRAYHIKKDREKIYKIYSNTIKEKYGCENGFQSEIIKEKSINTLKKKYGVINISQTSKWKTIIKGKSDEIHKKMYKTLSLKCNGNLHNSKAENEIYDLLIQKHSDTIRQYRNDLYPFACDFYIPKLNLYIEYQGFFSHGPINFNYNGKIYNCHCPFDPNNLIHQEVIKFWKNKNTEKYNKAIYTWTISDPLKRKTAKENGLNWIEFFTMEEFMNWYNKN